MVPNHNLAKAISDCSWGMFCTMLKYKAEWQGKTYIEVVRKSAILPIEGMSDQKLGVSPS